MPRAAAKVLPNPLNRALVERVFATSFDKGLRYFREGRVTLTVQDARHADGTVAGSGSSVYATSVSLESGTRHATLHGVCSCPIGGSCKHVVALALAWIDARTPRAPLVPFVADPQAPPPPLPATHNPWPHWVVDSERRARIATPDDAADTAVRYLILVDGQSLLVRPVRCRGLKDGRLGACRTVRLDTESTLKRIRKMPREDRALLLGFDPDAAIERDGDTWLVMHGGDEVMIESILATGRARHLEANGAPLKLGPMRAIELAWLVHEDGSQSLAPRTTGAEGAVFGATWGWYLDAASGLIGRTDTGALAPRIAELRSLPKLSPEHVAEAQAALARRGLDAVVPPPAALRVDVRRAVSLRAMLTLKRPPWDHDVDRLRHGLLAELRFRYGDETIPADDPRAALRTRRDTDIEVLAREPAFERTVARFLGREGFTANSHVPRLNNLPGEARMWQRPHPLAGEAIALWALGFADRARTFGIAVDADEYFPVFVGLELEAPELEVDESGGDWFETRLGVVIDGQRLDLLPILLRALDDPTATSTRGLRVTLPDGRHALVPRERMRTILALLGDLEQRGDKLGVPRARLPAIVPPPDWRFVPGARAREFLAELEAFRGLDTNIAPPPEFRAELRPYQSLGLAWLDFLRRFGFGGVLADDMGLGKTVQVLAYLARERAEGRLANPALVVCPTSVAPNWLAEAHRFAPGLRVLMLARGDRSAALASLADHDLVITSYALLLRDTDALHEQAWSLAVFDESQWLKNRASQGYRMALKIKAPMRLCLTGTPVENHLGELKAQFDLVMPGLLGEDRAFLERFRHPIEKARDAAASAQLRQRLRPFLMRRTKAEVATELPPRTYIPHSVELGDAQRDLYETIRLQMEKRVRDALSERGLARSHITVLDALLKLRQVCCDPALVDLPSARKVDASAKREALMDLLPTLIEDGRNILLFSQFTSMLDLIEQDLVARGQPFVRLDGSTTNRATPVQKFQRGEVPLFLISLKAGGVGLNLTRADTVILYDPWWNPAAEAQAIDRAHRIGQDKPVFVYELNCVGTVEEKMQALKARKRAIADAVLAGEDAALDKLGAEDLLALFAPSATA